MQKKLTNFSTDGVMISHWMLRILNLYVLGFCGVSVLWSVWLHGPFNDG